MGLLSLRHVGPFPENVWRIFGQIIENLGFQFWGLRGAIIWGRHDEYREYSQFKYDEENSFWWDAKIYQWCLDLFVRDFDSVHLNRVEFAVIWEVWILSISKQEDYHYLFMRKLYGFWLLLKMNKLHLRIFWARRSQIFDFYFRKLGPHAAWSNFNFLRVITHFLLFLEWG